MSRQLPKRALRDRLMSRGKNCLPIVSRQFLTRNYPRPNCLLKCLPNCLSPTREGFLSSFKIDPAVRVITRQVRDKNCLAAIFAPRHQSVSSGPLGWQPPNLHLQCSEFVSDKILSKLTLTPLHPVRILQRRLLDMARLEILSMRASVIPLLRAALDGRKRAFWERTRACRNARFENISCRNGFWTSVKAMVDSVSVRFKNASVSKR